MASGLATAVGVTQATPGTSAYAAPGPRRKHAARPSSCLALRDSWLTTHSRAPDPRHARLVVPQYLARALIPPGRRVLTQARVQALRDHDVGTAYSYNCWPYSDDRSRYVLLHP